MYLSSESGESFDKVREEKASKELYISKIKYMEYKIYFKRSAALKKLFLYKSFYTSIYNIFTEKIMIDMFK